MRIEACFDSHVHWPATGEFATRLRLDELRAPNEVSVLKEESIHFRGEWLLGFGWDDNGWAEPPHRRFLDERFGQTPVAFKRADGHGLWVNGEALRRAGLWHTRTDDDERPDGRIVRDAEGWPTGVLIDRAADAVEKLIPALDARNLRRHLLRGMQVFNQAGFTHIRDMTCDEAQWQEALKLDEAGVLTLAVEEYFWLKRAEDLDRVLDLARRARATVTPNLRVQGLKLFLDGALASEGAWLSRCYHGSDRRGLILWEKAAVREVLTRCWQAGLEPALHAIGDEAAAWLIAIANELRAAGQVGTFHIEHAELLRPETIAAMSGLDVHCHLQPAHWLNDRAWLRRKLGDLAEYAFPWRRLQEAQVAFDFGSDAPIAPASVSRTMQALRESAGAGIPRLLGEPLSYMGHPDLAWAPNSFTLFAEEAPVQVLFRGEDLI